MTGTYFLDANETNLLDGLALDEDDTYITTTALEAGYPGFVSFDLVLPDPAAADDATIQVDIIGCDTSDFSTGPVIPIASFSFLGEAAHNVAVAAGQDSYVLRTYVGTRFVKARAVVIDGTAGDWNAGDAAVLVMRPFTYDMTTAARAEADTDTWHKAAGPFNPST